MCLPALHWGLYLLGENSELITPLFKNKQTVFKHLSDKRLLERICVRLLLLIIIKLFYIALFSALEQTHCARMWFYMSEYFFYTSFTPPPPRPLPTTTSMFCFLMGRECSSLAASSYLLLFTFFLLDEEKTCCLLGPQCCLVTPSMTPNVVYNFQICWCHHISL